MSPNASLPSLRLEPGATLVQAEPWHTHAVTLSSPALDVMTDLKRTKAATTAPGTSLRHAEQLMIFQGVRMLFVTGGMPAIEGLVTSTDLAGDQGMRVVQQRGAHYDELTVADVMTRVSSLDAIAYADVARASVGNLVATLKRVGRNHLLVVEGQAIRGVVSRSQIERQLGQLIELTEVAHSFAEVERALA